MDLQAGRRAGACHAAGPVLPPLVLIALAWKIAFVGLLAFTPWKTAAWVSFFPLDLLVLYHLFVPTAGGLCPTINSFATDRREIWLTIDDGPDPHDTPRILDLLEAHKARATFFLIGNHAAAHPELVREILRRGHTVGCHTQTHPLGTFWFAGPRRVAREIDACLATLRDCGATVTWFRAPVGIKNLVLAEVLRRRELHCLGWSVRSLDGIAREPGQVVSRVVGSLRPGAIVLMHEGSRVHPAVRVAALARVLAEVEARGFRCVIPPRPVGAGGLRSG